MRLIGSKIEMEFREELQASNKGFGAPSRLRSALEDQGHPTDRAFVLFWTPDQDEDIYGVLIDGAYLVVVEIDRHHLETPPRCERLELKEHKRGLSKVNQIKLLVAQDLAGKKT